MAYFHFFDGEGSEFWEQIIAPYLPDSVGNDFIIDAKTVAVLNTFGKEVIPHLTVEKNWNATLLGLRVDAELQANMKFLGNDASFSVGTQVGIDWNEVEGIGPDAGVNVIGQMNGLGFTYDSQEESYSTRIEINLTDNKGKLYSHETDLVLKASDSGKLTAAIKVDKVLDVIKTQEIEIQTRMLAFEADIQFDKDTDGLYYISQESVSMGNVGYFFGVLEYGEKYSDQYRVSIDNFEGWQFAASNKAGGSYFHGNYLAQGSSATQELVGETNSVYSYLIQELPNLQYVYSNEDFLRSICYHNNYPIGVAGYVSGTQYPAAVDALNQIIGGPIYLSSASNATDLKNFIDDVKAQLVAQGVDPNTYEGNFFIADDISQVESRYEPSSLSRITDILNKVVSSEGDLLGDELIERIKEKITEDDLNLFTTTAPVDGKTYTSEGTFKYIHIDGEVTYLNIADFKIIEMIGQMNDVLSNGEQTILQNNELIEVVPGVSYVLVSSSQTTLNGEVVTITSTIAADSNGIALNGAHEQITRVHTTDGKITGRVTEFVDDAGYVHKVAERHADGETNSLVREAITLPDGTLVEGNTIVVPSSELLETLQFVGGTAGNLLGSHLADGNHYQDIVYSTLLKSIGEHFGTFSAYLAQEDNTFANSAKRALGEEVEGSTLLDDPEFSETFFNNLQSQLSGKLSSLIVSEVGEALGIDGTIGGEIFNVVGDTITTGVVHEIFGMRFNGLDGAAYTTLLKSGFDFSAPIVDPNKLTYLGADGTPIPNSTVGDFVQAQIVNALAGFAGSRLAGEVIEPEDEVAAVFGAAGGAVGTAVATGHLMASTALGEIFASGVMGGPVGIAVAVFVGTIVGTAFGNVFGDEETPAAWARVSWDETDDEYQLNTYWNDDGGSIDVSNGLAQQMVDAVNEIIANTQGGLRQGASAPYVQIGYEGDTYMAGIVGGEMKAFDNPGDAVMHGAFSLLKSFDLVGGHAIMMRAWHNSDAENIHEFREDIQIAEAFQNYLLDPTAILAMIMNDQDSDLAQSWGAILARAAELELHLPHEKDLDGGWGEILLAQGVDPSLIPDIQDNSIILTNDETGEQTVLQHFIGPGYEIVRIEGDDGNDIIEVIVDGPSVNYIDAGPGDDIVIGSDQADVIVGGAGDDTLDGMGGNDWIHGGTGDDHIDGGAGDDLIIGSDDNDYLVGGSENDKIYGNAGDDELYASGGGDDYLYGGDGNDYLQGSGKAITYDPTQVTNNTLHGGNGDDILVGVNHDTLIGGTGNDLYQVGESGYANKFVIYRDQGHDVIESSWLSSNNLYFKETISVNELYFTQSENDLKIYVIGEDQSVTVKNFYADTNVPIINIVAHDGKLAADSRAAILQAVANDSTISEVPTGQYNYISDQALASATNDFESGGVWDVRYDSFICGEDADSTISSNSKAIIGSAGDDYIEGITGSGFQALYGDSGNDIIKGLDREDYVVGGLGNDSLYGGGDRDFLMGGYGDDYLEGGSGDDALQGNAGDDFLYGNEGNDGLNGGDGNDYLYDNLGDNILRGGAGNDNISTDQGYGDNTLNGGAGNDIIIGGLGSDTISGGDDNDIIAASDGNDWLAGEDGDDDLNGGFGDDILSGGLGNDTLRGGLGDNTLSGGEGDDTYLISLVEEQPKHALKFNETSSNDYAMLQNAAIGVNNMTVALSYQFSEDSNFDDALFHYATSQQRMEFALSVNPNVGLTIKIAGIPYKPSYDLNNHDEHNFVVSWDGDNGLVHFYDNGELIETFTGAFTGALHTGGTLSLGQFQSSVGTPQLGSGLEFTGSMYNVAVWDRALTQAEATASDLPTSDALHDFDFADQSQANVLVNATGAGNMQLSGNCEWVAPIVVDESYVTYLQNQTVVNPALITFNETGNNGCGTLQNTSIGTDNMTVALTYQFSEDSNFDSIPFNYASSGRSHLEFKLAINPNVGLVIKIAGQTYKPNYLLNDYDEHTLVVGWNGDNGTLNIYDNGQLIGAYTGVYTGSLEQGGTLTLAQGQSSMGVVQSGYQLDGDMKAVTVWDRALTDAEITGETLPAADALHDFDFSDISQSGVLVNNTGNGDVQLSGDYERFEGSTDIHDALKVDTISDVSGSDTLHVAGDFDISDLSFERDPDSLDNLFVKLLGNHVVTIEKYFTDGTIEQLKFDDGTTHLMSDLTISLSGDDADNTLIGTAQADAFTGGQGVDTFVLNSLQGGDSIQDFDLSEGDILDISEILEGYDPDTDAITNFVQITDNGTDSIVSIDTNGGADNFVQIATVLNVTSLPEEEVLETSGNLVTV